MNCLWCYDEEDRNQDDLKWTYDYVFTHYVSRRPNRIRPPDGNSFTMNNKVYHIRKNATTPFLEAIDDMEFIHFTRISFYNNQAELTVRLPPDIRCSAYLICTVDQEMRVTTLLKAEFRIL